MHRPRVSNTVPIDQLISNRWHVLSTCICLKCLRLQGDFNIVIHFIHRQNLYSSKPRWLLQLKQSITLKEGSLCCALLFLLASSSQQSGESSADNRVNRLLCYCWLIAGVILELHNSFKEIFDIYEMTSIIN